MDFPTCPSCGQSVIDDDVDDCPFCGSSMKAKPGSKPAAKSAASKPAAGASKPAAKPAAPAPTTKPAPSGRPGAKPGPADDFPFEAEAAGSRTAIQAMPNSSKGRTLEVTCPMCETKGFVPPTAAGKEVKCANPACMVPVFKAPSANTAPPPPAEPVTKSGNMMMVGGITVAAVAVLGAGFVFLPGLLGPRSSAPKVSEEALELMREMAQSQPSANPATPSTTPATPAETTLPDARTTDAAPQTPEQYIAASLKLLNDASLKGEGRQQRSKAFCRQMAAGACALAGDLKAASDHLAQLAVVGPNVTYYRIEPTLELFWRAWGSGDEATARRHLETAMTDAKRLPSVGRTRLDLAGRLAAALVIAGRTSDAQTLLGTHQSGDSDGQLAAQIQMASDGRIAPVTRNRSTVDWAYPQAVAATAALVVHGQSAAARTWAEAQAGDRARVECLATWAEFSTAQKSAIDVAGAVKTLTPALAARIWARAAMGHYAAGDQAAAAAALKSAQDLLATVPVPQELDLPAPKSTIGFTLPADAPLVQAAQAASEIAFAHTLWSDHTADAEAALELGLKFTRGIAPAWPAVSARVAEVDQAGQSGLREMLKRELAIKSDDIANQNALKYRKVVDDLEAASQVRTSLQESMLLRLVARGLKDKAWSVVSNRGAEPNLSRRDDFLKSPLVGALVHAFQGTETEKTILGAIPSGSTPQYPDTIVADHLLQDNVTQAAQFVSQCRDRDYVALATATRLAADGKAEAALNFISRLDDLVLREECYRLAGAIIGQRNQPALAWNQAASLQQATEKACLTRGLVAGLKADPAARPLAN